MQEKVVEKARRGVQAGDPNNGLAEIGVDRGDRLSGSVRLVQG